MLEVYINPLFARKLLEKRERDREVQMEQRLRLVEGICGQIEDIDDEMRSLREQMQIIRTAEDALAQIQTILLKMRQLAVRVAAEGADAPREQLQRQFAALKGEIDSVVRRAQLGGINLIDGSFGSMDDVIRAISETLE